MERPGVLSREGKVSDIRHTSNRMVRYRASRTHVHTAEVGASRRISYRDLQWPPLAFGPSAAPLAILAAYMARRAKALDGPRSVHSATSAPVCAVAFASEEAPVVVDARQLVRDAASRAPGEGGHQREAIREVIVGHQVGSWFENARTAPMQARRGSTGP